MLTEVACKAASCPPEKKPRARFTDDRGLYLEVSAAGSKRWFCKYAIAGQEKRLALGSYPEVKLKATREARDEARKLQRAGTDPVQQRKVDKAAALPTMPTPTNCLPGPSTRRGRPPGARCTRRSGCACRRCTAGAAGPGFTQADARTHGTRPLCVPKHAIGRAPHV